MSVLTQLEEVRERRHLGERCQTGSNQIQTGRHDFTEVADTTAASPTLYCHNKGRGDRGACYRSGKIEVRDVSCAILDELG